MDCGMWIEVSSRLYSWRKMVVHAWEVKTELDIGVGDGGSRRQLPPRFGQKLFFSGKNRVKFGHFVNFFRAYVM